MENYGTAFLYLASAAFGVFVFSMVVILLKRNGEEKDAFHNRLTAIAGKKVDLLYMNEELNKPLSERLIKPLGDKFINGIKKISYQTNSDTDMVDARSAKMKLMLRQAGMKFTVAEYGVFRIIIFTISGLLIGLFLFLFSNNILVALMGVLFGIYLAYVILRFRLTTKVSTRKKSMQSQLPEVLDMLSISVEAGLGLEQALIEVVKHFNGPLIDEIAISNREMTMGRSRDDALRLLGERCDIEEMQTFTRAIIQATQMGIAVKNVLRTQAEYMRQTHKNKIEEKAMKVSVKILIPMAFFILPVIFIVLLGPAAIGIMDAFN